ncbi:MAG: hypothetical protein PHI53_00865 [Candidatus Pacebacteria bacterium]|nr:hypothetical protein [Candidatus Paceibacterota bacterium]
MKSIIIEDYKNKLSFSKRLGKILGDGHLEKLYTPGQGRLKVEHSYKQKEKEYVDWFYKEFKNWVRTEPKQKIKKVWGKIHSNYGFSTYGHRLLGNFHKDFYQDRKTDIFRREIR